MLQLRSGKFFFLLVLLLCCFQSRSQQVLNDVQLKEISSSVFRVQYKLRPTEKHELEKADLKILRRRNGIIEEVFSKDITGEISKTPGGQNYTYDWKAGSGIVKPGDEFQAKVVVALKPVLARSDPALPNKMPRADAGAFLQLDLPNTKPIVLNGSRSHDEDGKIVSVQWKQIAGPTTLSIQKSDSVIAYAAGKFQEGTYAFELSVKDDKGAISVGRTVLTVRQAPVVITQPPATNTRKIDSPATSRPSPQAQEEVALRLKGRPSNAAINVLVPGLGHYFVSGDGNGENRKASAFIVTALYAGSIGGAFYFRSKSQEDYGKYNELAAYKENQKYANGIIIGIRGGNEAEAGRYLKSAKDARRNALICLGAGGTILVTDLVYTFIKGSRNKKLWKESTSFKPNLFISSDGYQNTAGLKFKF